MDEEPALSHLLADRTHLSHLLQDFTSGVVSATAEDIAALREELGLIEGQISASTGGEGRHKLSYNIRCFTGPSRSGRRVTLYKERQPS